MNRNCHSMHAATCSTVLTTNVSQINLCQLLFRGTLKVRLDSCLSLLLEWTTLTFHSLSMGGASHSRVEACIASPASTPRPPVNDLIPALFHTQPLFSTLVYWSVAPTIRLQWHTTTRPGPTKRLQLWQLWPFCCLYTQTCFQK